MIEVEVFQLLVLQFEILQKKERTFMHLWAEGKSTEKVILEIGNTNSRHHLSIGARRFISEWNAWFCS